MLNFLLTQTILFILCYALCRATVVSEERSILPLIKTIFASEERSIIAFNYTPAHRLCEGPIAGIMLALLQLRFSLSARRKMPPFSI